MLTLARAAAAAPTLFGATAGSGPGELYTLNPANGAVLTDVGPLVDLSGTHYGITGMVFDPASGALFGSSANSSATPANAHDMLVKINPLTGAVLPIGPLNVGAGNTMTDLAIDPATHVLYGIGSVGGPNLYTINTSTGQATLVGTTGIGFTTGGGVDVAPDGTIYGSPDGGRFGTYNKSTGAYTQIADPGPEPLGGSSGYNAMSFNDTGVLYGVNSANSTTAPHLVTFNLGSGAVTDLGASVLRLDSIAFQIVPEPASAALLAVAAAGVLVGPRRRRRPDRGA
jgi:hypothetical protein